MLQSVPKTIITFCFSWYLKKQIFKEFYPLQTDIHTQISNAESIELQGAEISAQQNDVYKEGNDSIKINMNWNLQCVPN